MRRLVLPLLLLAVPASADRGAVWSVGLTADGRATGATFPEAGKSTQMSWLGGARLTLSFEDTPLAMPPPTLVAHDFRLVPELLTGFAADDLHAEGYLGAGLRGELQLAGNRSLPIRAVMYAAARAIVIGGQQDGATELVIGEYLSSGAGKRRFGWEGGAMIRPRAQADSGSRELDAVMSVYFGWQ